MLHATHSRILLLAASALVLFGLGACAAIVGSNHGAQTRDIAQLTAQAHAWDQAIVRKDQAGIAGSQRANHPDAQVSGGAIHD